MTKLSLRLRIFLFFALMGLGGAAVTVLGLWMGYQRLGDPGAAEGFVQAGIVACLGILGLAVGIWTFFDEHVSRPIERMSAALRARAHAGADGGITDETAPYLGDLAPAARAVCERLGQSTLERTADVAARTASLAEDKAQLTALLTELPVAMVLVGPAHQIVLYDGQAAAVLGLVAPPRLNAPIFDYVDESALRRAYEALCREGRDQRLRLPAAGGGQVFSAHLRALGTAPGYLLTIEETETTMDPAAARPLVYDFSLLSHDAHGKGASTLSSLTYVAFDTETTGLLPHKDEVVQIGAVRLLGARLVPGEELDMLVDPGRPIPEVSRRVHGISDAMVAGAPPMPEAARVLHHFARGAVLVAHNAPFDMAFLHKSAEAAGLTWDHPILDTVLLSAVVFGTQESHTLDALCARLGIEIPEAHRHTALGDALATGEALARLIPLLEARGITTFEALLTETRRHGRLLEDLNSPPPRQSTG